MNEEATRKAIVVAVFVRWIVLMTVLVMTAVGNNLSTSAPSHAILLAIALYATGTAIYAWKGKKLVEPFGLVMTAVDVLMITLLIGISGGVRSQYYVLYYLPVMLGGVLLRFRDAIGAAVLSAALYTFVAVAELGGPSPSAMIAERAGVVSASALALVGFLSVVSKQIKVQRQTAQRLHSVVERLAAVYDVGRATYVGGVSEILNALVCQALRVSSASCAVAATMERGQVNTLATGATGGGATPPQLDAQLAAQAVNDRAPTAAHRLEDGAWVHMLCMPLLVAGQARGVLQARRTGKNGLAPEEIDALAAICAEAASALDNVALREQLARSAATDYLTGLANRREFERALVEQVRECQRHKANLAVVMIDIDGFKRCNDLAGHAVGDQVLREVAQALRGAIRQEDLAARYGGDEFAVMLPGADLELARRATERMQRAAKARSDGVELLPGPVTTSAGITLWQHDQSAADLIRQADRIMYRAKHHGRNCLITDEQVASGCPVAEEDEASPRREYADVAER